MDVGTVSGVREQEQRAEAMFDSPSMSQHSCLESGDSSKTAPKIWVSTCCFKTCHIVGDAPTLWKMWNTKGTAHPGQELALFCYKQQKKS